MFLHFLQLDFKLNMTAVVLDCFFFKFKHNFGKAHTEKLTHACQNGFLKDSTASNASSDFNLKTCTEAKCL